jgi:hypothetical protein
VKFGRGPGITSSGGQKLGGEIDTGTIVKLAQATVVHFPSIAKAVEELLITSPIMSMSVNDRTIAFFIVLGPFCAQASVCHERMRSILIQSESAGKGGPRSLVSRPAIGPTWLGRPREGRSGTEAILKLRRIDGQVRDKKICRVRVDSARKTGLGL